MDEDDALLIHWAIHAGDDEVTLGNGTKLTIDKGRNGCSECVTLGYRFMQQNPTKTSNWARMARQGRKITWIISGRQWGRIVDNKIEQQPSPPLVKKKTMATVGASSGSSSSTAGQAATMTVATTTATLTTATSDKSDSLKGQKRLASFFDSKPDETIESKKLKLGALLIYEETKVFTLEIQFPVNWMTPLNKPQRVKLQPSDGEWAKIQKMMCDTISDAHRARFQFKSVRITQLERLQHPNLWGHYFLRREEVKRANDDHPEPIEGVKTGRTLDPTANEYYLFHGLSHSIVDKIIEAGFDERVSNLAGMFGCGIYFAEDCSKSMQYSHAADCQQVGAVYASGSNQCTCMRSLQSERCMFLCRVSLGTAWIRLAATDKDKPLRRPPERDNGQLYDSVLGESRAWEPSAALDFREYIVYDRRQCYPEYLIKYVRTNE